MKKSTTGSKRNFVDNRKQSKRDKRLKLRKLIV
jgi:hypothetical protein